MTPEQLQTLKTELSLPAYTGLGDEAAADALNAQTKTPQRETISAGSIVSCVVRAEYEALTAESRRYLDFVISGGSVPNTQAVRQGLRSIFPNGSASDTNIQAALKRTGSRADELGLPRVTPSHVARARRL